MKITGQKKYLIAEQNVRWTLFFECQFVLNADKYSVTLTKWGSDGTIRERTFAEASRATPFPPSDEEFDDMNQSYYNLDECEDIIYELQALNMLGYDIYMTPFSDEYFYVVLDEVELSEKEMWEFREKYLPCLIIGTPTKKYQFILKVRKTEVGNDHERLNQFVRHINEKYNGNKSVSNIIHGFRVPGYSSRGPDDEIKCPFIPLVLSNDYYSVRTEIEIRKFLKAGNKKQNMPTKYFDKDGKRVYSLTPFSFDITEYSEEALNALTKFTIPDGVQRIGIGAFSDYVEERNYPFNVDKRNTGRYNVEFKPGIKRIIMPDSVKSIDQEAFSQMVCLKEICFSNALESIGEWAFSNCSIEKLELPSSIKHIGENAFEFCLDLKSVKIPDGLEVLPKEAFQNCISLKKVVLPSTIKEIGDSAFLYCYKLKNIELPEGLTTIGNGAFISDVLKKIYIPSSVTQISDDAFADSMFSNEKNKSLVILCHENSYAHKYAQENKIKFELTSER